MGNDKMDTKVCAILFAAMLFMSAIIVFPYYMQPEPSPSVALLFSLIPMAVLLYSIYLLLFMW